MIKFSRAIMWMLVGLAVGGGVWFGVQIQSGQDNFSDQINPLYLVALYGVAFLLGVAARTMAFAVGIALPFSQVISFVLYPNVEQQLSNLYPITGGLIFLITIPAVLAAHFGGKARKRLPW